MYDADIPIRIEAGPTAYEDDRNCKVLDMTGLPSVAVVIASLGRPDLLDSMIERMETQTLKPQLLLFSTVAKGDLPEGFANSEGVKAIFGPKGLPRQRNNALDFLGTKYDIILFYDDDFVPSLHSVEYVARFFAAHPDVIGATGRVLADGINTAGIGREEAEQIVAGYDRTASFDAAIKRDLFGLYGCNMAYRSSAIGDVRFDERLRLYGWQEDIDFTGSLLSRGRFVWTWAFAGVHQGAKHGRTPGRRLGYSQVINPLYLARKGTMRRWFALALIARNLFANHRKAFWSEPWADRKGRVAGNWIGIWDALRGRLTPERIEEL